MQLLGECKRRIYNDPSQGEGDFPLKKAFIYGWGVGDSGW